MYVCICQAVTEKQVRRAVERGVRDYAGLRDNLGVGAVCGRCKDCACQTLEETLAAREQDDEAASSLIRPLPAVP